MHDLPEFKAADLTRHTSDLFDAAIRSPIAITKHRKPKFVLMSMDQYQSLMRGATQQAHMVDEMPEDLKALMIEGLERDLTRADDSACRWRGFPLSVPVETRTDGGRDRGPQDAAYLYRRHCRQIR